MFVCQGIALVDWIQSCQANRFPDWFCNLLAALLAARAVFWGSNLGSNFGSKSRFFGQQFGQQLRQQEPFFWAAIWAATSAARAVLGQQFGQQLRQQKPFLWGQQCGQQLRQQEPCSVGAAAPSSPGSRRRLLLFRNNLPAARDPSQPHCFFCLLSMVLAAPLPNTETQNMWTPHYKNVVVLFVFNGFGRSSPPITETPNVWNPHSKNAVLLFVFKCSCCSIRHHTNTLYVDPSQEKRCFPICFQ